MGLFGLFGKKKISKGSKTPSSEENPPAPGWNVIEDVFRKHYVEQAPKWWEHKGVHRMNDLYNPPENPLEAVAIFDSKSFWHYLSFGMSDLFAKETEGEWSGFGYEFTFRLAKGESDRKPPLWPVNINMKFNNTYWAHLVKFSLCLRDFEILSILTE